MSLSLQASKTRNLGTKHQDVWTGLLVCNAHKQNSCGATFPILAGVAVLVPDPGLYLCGHARGIAAIVEDRDIPENLRSEYLEAKSELDDIPEDWDLESSRLVSLYLLNHYAQAKDIQASALFNPWIKKLWNQGVFKKIQTWFKSSPKQSIDCIELACGVGGLPRYLDRSLRTYLGFDTSFLSIAIARHLNLGAPFSGKIEVPSDLIAGSVSRPLKIRSRNCDGRIDYVVGDLLNPPILPKQADLAVVLNVIDMLDEPEALAFLQAELIKPRGKVVHASPYIWAPFVAKNLQETLPKNVSSKKAALELYKRAGFKIRRQMDDIPWLFFKHERQMELYATHLFEASK